MSIATAIAATSPNLWYKLDETSGTTAVNAGSLSNNGTYSGSLAQGVEGPENGTFATRLFSTGQVVSAAMDISVVRDLSLGMWVSTDSSATLGTHFPIVSIGDVSNRLNRGPQLYEAHTTIGQPIFGGAWRPPGGAQQTAGEPRKFWHWVVLTVTQSTAIARIYVDLIAPLSAGLGSTVAALLTDPLLIRSDEPLVIAHVCFWNRVLSQAEINSVSNQVAPWPYTVPINTPPEGGGGGGGLTPDQATQLAEIDTKTDDIPGLVDAVNFISDTVNTTQGLVDEIHSWVSEIRDDVGLIKSAVDHISGEQLVNISDQVLGVSEKVQRVFQTAAGVGLSTPLGSLIAHPDPNFLSYSAETFLLSGRGELTPPTGPFATRPYGIAWDATTVPPSAGLRDGSNVEFINRLVQFCPMYPEAGSGILYIPEVADFRYKAFYWLWQRYTPQVLQYDVSPGFELTCRWIVAL